MSLLRIYCIVIVLLVVAYMIFYTHRKRITKTLVDQIDTLLYLFDKAVYANKEQIFDYDTTKTLLYHNQQQFFQKGKDYPHFLPLLLQDVTYINTLINTQIVDAQAIQSLQETYVVWEKLHTLKKYTHTILIILTLGIAKLFLP